MKRVFSRTSLIAVPVIALAVVAPSANAAMVLHSAAQAKPTTVAVRVDPTPAGSPLDNPIATGADIAGDAFGAFGVAVSKIPIIGPMITGLGEGITSLFTTVPIIGDAAQSAINTYNDNGK